MLFHTSLGAFWAACIGWIAECRMHPLRDESSTVPVRSKILHAYYIRVRLQCYSDSDFDIVPIHHHLNSMPLFISSPSIKRISPLLSLHTSNHKRAYPSLLATKFY